MLQRWRHLWTPSNTRTRDTLRNDTQQTEHCPPSSTSHPLSAHSLTARWHKHLTQQLTRLAAKHADRSRTKPLALAAGISAYCTTMAFILAVNLEALTDLRVCLAIASLALALLTGALLLMALLEHTSHHRRHLQKTLAQAATGGQTVVQCGLCKAVWALPMKKQSRAEHQSITTISHEQLMRITEGRCPFCHLKARPIELNSWHLKGLRFENITIQFPPPLETADLPPALTAVVLGAAAVLLANWLLGVNLPPLIQHMQAAAVSLAAMTTVLWLRRRADGTPAPPRLTIQPDPPRTHSEKPLPEAKLAMPDKLSPAGPTDTKCDATGLPENSGGVADAPVTDMPKEPPDADG